MRISARVLLAGIVCMAACSTSAQMPSSQGPATVVAMVGSSPVTLADVDEHGLDRPAADFGSLRLSQALYEARRSALDAIIGNMLFDAEARSRGIDRAALIEKEIAAKVETPTEAEINEWYQANPARVQGAALDQVRAPIRQLLTQRRTQIAREAFLDTLRKKTAVKIALDPPRQKIADARPAVPRPGDGQS